jgi:hypothetical protein
VQLRKMIYNKERKFFAKGIVMKKQKFWILVFCFLYSFQETLVQADRGAIVPVGDVNIEEPAQRAIIAHNGVREILILQTDVKADKAIKVVEFMPLPSKPDVSLAPEKCFAELQKIIEAHNLQYVIRYRGKTAADAKGEAIKVVVSEQLGPHKLIVVEVKDANEFVKWAERFFDENDLGRPRLDKKLREIVADYLRRDIRFFAFDVVTLSPQKKTVRPLVYSFKSAELYYPLKVTNLYGGSGTIELLVILPRELREAGLWISASYGIKENGKGMTGFFRSTSAELNAAEMTRIEPDIAGLMENGPAILKAVKYDGTLDFDEDLTACLGYYSAGIVGRKFFEALEKGNIDMLSTLVKVPFAFDRKRVITDEKGLLESLRKLSKESRLKNVEFFELHSATIEDCLLEDDFDKSFVAKYFWKHARTVDKVIWVQIDNDKILLFVKQVKYGMYKVVGFSD